MSDPTGAAENQARSFENEPAASLKGDISRSVTLHELASRSRPISQSSYSAEYARARLESQNLELRIRGETLRKLRQQHGQRRAFFGWAITAISAVLAASGGLFAWYISLKGAATEPAVMIAWLSSGLVETLGLGYIIANYLFESQRSDEGSRHKK